MKKLDSKGLRQEYLNFFKSKGHAVIPSASLVPENDPTVLFTTAGMHPLVPYLLGEKHPAGNRLTDVQKCVRTGDIDSVGDKSHCTFFEMLGNWSLGDYFKKESIAWSYEFLTTVLGIASDSLAVTVFKGDENAPRDLESAAIWESAGISRERIFFLPKEDNWWGPAGLTGPCGPDTEIFYDNGQEPCGADCNPSCKCGKYLEIWNNVFMEYRKTEQGTYEPLIKKNVDTGMGLERTICVLNGLKSVYESDLFAPVIKLLEEASGIVYGADPESTRGMRIIADHVRTAVFIISDGIVPSNVDQGYVLRRLIRRAVRFGRKLNLPVETLSLIVNAYIDKYSSVYPELADRRVKIVNELELEVERFNKTLEQGMKEFEKVVFYTKGGALNGKTAFRLYDTFGFPIEITEELAAEKGLAVDREGYEEAFREHQKKSQAGAEQKFKGGLQDNSDATTKLHTATHLMHAALIKVLGGNVKQRGSNITAERLRFDFEFARPMTEEEIAEVERLVNKAIEAKIPVICREMTVDEAYKEGAIGVFQSKYGDVVKVYSAGDFSKEICGGPHAENTGILGKFTIQKEQSSSAGVRRIKAVLEE
jgi:alanyl-tRNA synthetase